MEFFLIFPNFRSKTKNATFEMMKKKEELRYNAWNEHLNSTRERINYSVRRMDLLIISISGAGIYIIFETLREFKKGQIEICNSSLIIASGIFFLLAIMVNFLSQRAGYQANTNEESYTLLKLQEIKGQEVDEESQQKLDKKVNRYNKLTEILNISSIILMFIGLIMLTVFNYHLF